MPSTRKQRAKERRSRQLDLMSDVENVDIVLGSYARDDERDDQSENELNLVWGSSRPQQSSNLVGEVFRSLLNTNSRENSEVTIETTRMISDDIANQVTRKFNDIRSSTILQIQEAFSTAITEKVLLSKENTLVTQGRSNLTMKDQRGNGLHKNPGAPNFTKHRKSSGLQRNSEAVNPQKTWESHQKMGLPRENQR